MKIPEMCEKCPYFGRIGKGWHFVLVILLGYIIGCVVTKFT